MNDTAETAAREKVWEQFVLDMQPITVPFTKKEMWEFGFTAGLAHARSWVRIRTADDLPKVAGRYLWTIKSCTGTLSTIVDDYDPVNLESPPDYLKNVVEVFGGKAIAWQELPQPFAEAHQPDGEEMKDERE